MPIYIYIYTLRQLSPSIITIQFSFFHFFKYCNKGFLDNDSVRLNPSIVILFPIFVYINREKALGVHYTVIRGLWNIQIVGTDSL